MQGYAVVVLAGLVTLARGQGAAKVDQSQILKDIANKFTAQLPVDIRCKTDPTNKLSCGVNFRQECEEKWNFKSPCTPENLARNLTIFPHPHAKNKFLMCGDFGKLYVVLCPRYEVYHEGCRQCVTKGSKLTATCGTHDIPLSESTASNPCTHEAIASGKLFFPFPNDLGKYLHCDAWGKAWEMICTPGEVWNQNQLACVNPALMNPCFQSFRNPGLLYRHPCDPHKYIRCDSESIPYEVPCQVGDIFSEANQVCQSASMYKVKPKNICGNYRFRFRSYAHSTFSIDPTKQRLANLEGQQTGTLSPSGSLNPGGEINTLEGAWKDTVNPSPGASIGAADLAIDLGTIDGTAAGGAGFAVSDSTGQSMTADSGWQASIDSLTSISGSASQDTTSVLSSSGSLGTNTATEFSSTGGSDIISPPSGGFAGQGAGSEFFVSTVGDTIISSSAGSEPGKKILSASGSFNSGKILSSTKTSGSAFPSTAGIVGQDLTASSTGDVFSTGGFSGIVTGADAGLGTELTGGTMSSGSSAGRLSTGANVKSTGSLNIVGDFSSSTSDQATHIINSAITEVASVDAGLQSAKKSGRFDLSGSVTTNSAHISGRLDPALSGTTGVQSFELGGQLISKSVPVESRGAETGMGGFAVVDPINSGVVDPAGIGKVGLSAADQSSKTVYTTVDASFTGGTVGASSMSSGVSSDGHADTSAISGNTLTIVGDSSLPADTVVLDLTGTSSQGNAAADGFTGIESLAKTMVGLIDSSQPIPGVDFASSASTSSAGEGPIVDAGAALGQTDASGPVATQHIGAVAAGTGTESTFSVAGSSLDSTAANTIGSPSLGAAAVEGAVTGTIYNGIPGGVNTGSMDVFFNSAGIAEGTGAASTGGTFRGSANTATTSLDSASTGSVDSRIFDQAASIDRAAFSSMVDSLIGQGNVADSVSALLGSPGPGTATLQSADTGSTSAVTFDSSATGALLDSLVHSIGANTMGSASYDSTGQTGTGSVNAVKGDMGAIGLDQVRPGLQSTIINVGAGTGIESNLLGAGARAIIKDQTTSFASDSTGGGSGSIAQSFGHVTTSTSSAGASVSHPDNTANIVGTGRALIHGGTETSGAARRDIDLGIVGTQVLKTDGSHVAVSRIGGTNGADTGGVGSKAASQSSSRVNPIDTPGARKVLLKEYVYSEIKNAEPCTAVNRKWNRTHFRLRANPKSFIQCDSQGNMYVRKCGDNLYFDYFTASCSHNKPVDGVIVK